MGAFAGLLTLVPRWLLLAGLLTCLASATVQTVRVGHFKTKLAEQELQYTHEKAVASAAVVTLQVEATARTKKATNDVKTKIGTLDSQLSASTMELERLRAAIAAGNSAAKDLAACTNRTDALGAVVDDCAKRYTEVARKADRIAIDRDALLALFPD